MAKDYQGKADFYVLYIRQIHPGENYPAHRTFDQKLAEARDVVKVDKLGRQVLVDDLNGTMHRDYGAYPNSAYLIGTDGVVALRAEWEDPAALKSQLDMLLARGGSGASIPPVEIAHNLAQVKSTLLATTLDTMHRAGFAALADFAFELPKLGAAHATAQVQRR